MSASQNLIQGHKIAFPYDPSGHGTDPMGREKLVNLAHFKAHNTHLIPEKTRKNHIYRKTWEEFVGQVDDGNDLEMISEISIVEKFGSRLRWSSALSTSSNF